MIKYLTIMTLNHKARISTDHFSVHFSIMVESSDDKASSGWFEEESDGPDAAFRCLGRCPATERATEKLPHQRRIILSTFIITASNIETI